MKPLLKILFLSFVIYYAIFSEIKAQTPTSSGLVFRLRADNGITLDGSGVSEWTDMSGSGFPAAQAIAAAQPTVVPNVMNSQPVVRFNGTTQYMELLSPSALGIQGGYEIFVVARANHNPGVAQFLIGGGFERYELHLDGLAGFRFIPAGPPYIDKGSDGNYTDLNPHIFSVRASATSGTVRVDGLDGATRAGDKLTDDDTFLGLGCRTASAGAGSFLCGDIAEVLIYDRVLDGTERDQVEAYAKTRYGINSGALPVEMNSFSAAVKDYKAVLSWATETEIDNYGFEIERAVVNGNKDAAQEYTKAGFVKGSGNSNSKKEYTFTDQEAPAGSLLYRIKQVDNNGAFKYYGPVSVNIAAPSELTLFQNSPNPFNPTTAINYYLPQQGNVTLKIYDQLGRLVSTLVDETKPAGSYITYWNGRDSNGNPVSSGVYIYRLSAGEYSQAKKMNLTK